MGDAVRSGHHDSSAGMKTVLELFAHDWMAMDNVDARLAIFTLIVRMNGFARADLVFRQLTATVRITSFALVVRAGAGTGLENIEWKMLVELSLHIPPRSTMKAHRWNEQQDRFRCAAAL